MGGQGQGGRVSEKSGAGAGGVPWARGSALSGRRLSVSQLLLLRGPLLPLPPPSKANPCHHQVSRQQDSRAGQQHRPQGSSSRAPPLPAAAGGALTSMMIAYTSSAISGAACPFLGLMCVAISRTLRGHHRRGGRVCV